MVLCYGSFRGKQEKGNYMLPKNVFGVWFAVAATIGADRHHGYQGGGVYANRRRFAVFRHPTG